MSLTLKISISTEKKVILTFIASLKKIRRVGGSCWGWWVFTFACRKLFLYVPSYDTFLFVVEVSKQNKQFTAVACCREVSTPPLKLKLTFPLFHHQMVSPPPGWTLCTQPILRYYSYYILYLCENAFDYLVVVSNINGL